MKREKQKRTRIIIFLSSILLLMTVGYATYNTNLNITGTSNISNSWDIEITNISDPVLTGSAKHVAKEIGSDKLSASMEADLYEKGDSAEYTVTIENKGSVDAALDSISKETVNSNQNIGISFSNYTKGQRLSAGNTIDIKVKIEYTSGTAFNTDNINNNIKLMSTSTLASAEAKITFNFVQAEGYKDSEDYPIPDTYLVEYDCTTNGGKDCSEFNEYLKEGESVNLSNTPSANKDGREFIGWNNTSDATEGINSLSVASEVIDENNKIKLYAIYEQITPLQTPSFEENIGEDKTTVTITYQEGCGNKLTCQYKIDDGDFQTVTTTMQNVEFTIAGSLVATVTNGIDTVSISYTPGIVYKGLEEVNFSYKNSVQEWEVPANGKYKLEVWGAQGGSYDTTQEGGKGGYSYGTINLKKGDKLYIYTGEQGKYNKAYSFTGGGKPSDSTSKTYSGGGASDIRINEDSLYARVIVAGGGGGATNSYSGGYGGGETGSRGGSMGTDGEYSGNPGTQTSGGIGKGQNSITNGSFGQGGSGYANSTSNYTAGGGGGWYGGSGGYYSYAAGSGGSGYVYTTETASNYPDGCLLDSSYYLTNAKTLEGDKEFTSPTGEDETGHSNNGYARISYKRFKNEKLSLSTSTSATKIAVIANTQMEDIIKYEFKLNNNEWIDNKKSNIYVFDELEEEKEYIIQVKLTTSLSEVSTSTKVTTNEIQMPTFSEETKSSIVNVAITYPSGCLGMNECYYSKNDGDWQKVDTKTIDIEFTGDGTLLAKVTDGTNILTTSSYTVAVGATATIKKMNVTTVATGDGLYNETSIDGRYTYKGSNPNNYFTFNGETGGWRIVSIEKDGTIKIIKTKSIENIAWDETGNRPTSSNTYTNSSYTYNNAWAATTNLVGKPSQFTQYYPNGSWNKTSYSGTVTQDASLNTYLNETYYKNTLKNNSNIDKHNFYVSTPGNYQDTESIATDVSQEKRYMWNGYVGLITATDYMRTTTNSACTSLYSSNANLSNCGNNNWLNNSTSYWTISPIVDENRINVCFVYGGGALSSNSAGGKSDVRPVVFIKSNINIHGNGTSGSPYYIDES